MSRPEDIPQDVWEAASRMVADAGNNGGGVYVLTLRPTISRALMAERAAERERCASLIEQNEIMDTSNGQYLRPRSDGNRAGIIYAAAIRKG